MELTDAQWSVVEPLIPQPKRRQDGRGRPWISARLVLDGIVWILRTGAPWRYLPREYPSYQTCHRRFQQWVKDGTLMTILAALCEELGVGSGDEAFIDGTYVAAKKGGSVSVAPERGKPQRSWLWRILEDCLSQFALRMAADMTLSLQMRHLMHRSFLCCHRD
jgi:transposase